MFIRRHLTATRAAFLVGLATIGTMFCIVLLVNQGNSGYAACKQVNRLSSKLLVLVERSAKTVPTLAYYKEHPTELKLVQVQNDETERALQPIPC